MIALSNTEDDDFERRDNRPQRRRYEEPPPGTRLRKQLNAVAESVGYHGRAHWLDKSGTNVRKQPMRNPEDEVQEIAKLAYENWEDNYVKEVYCDVTLALYVLDSVQAASEDGAVSCHGQSLTALQADRAAIQDSLRRSSRHARQRAQTRSGSRNHQAQRRVLPGTRRVWKLEDGQAHPTILGLSVWLVQRRRCLHPPGRIL